MDNANYVSGNGTGNYDVLYAVADGPGMFAIPSDYGESFTSEVDKSRSVPRYLEVSPAVEDPRATGEPTHMQDKLKQTIDNRNKMRRKKICIVAGVVLLLAVAVAVVRYYTSMNL